MFFAGYIIIAAAPNLGAVGAGIVLSSMYDFSSLRCNAV